MDWGQSYTSTWRVFKVNRDTWMEGEEIDNVDSISVTRTADGGLLESGDMETTGDLEADYYRVVLTAEQGGEVVRIDVATLLFDVTGGEIDYGTTKHSVSGHSVLYPASVTKITVGGYAPAGVDGAEYAARLLAGVINAPVEIEGGFTLNEHVVHEIGTSVLDATWGVLNAGGFIMQIDGRGIVHIIPKPTEPTLIIDESNSRLLTNKVSFTADESTLPNRYIVMSGGLKTIAENNDPTSRISTVSRGYYVDEMDESPTPVNGETLAAYAIRKLREVSKLSDVREYDREYAPGVFPGDIVKASIDGLEGDLRVESQSISCNYGITIQEKSTREVSLW